MFILPCLAEDGFCAEIDHCDKASELPGRERLWVTSDQSDRDGLGNTVAVEVGALQIGIPFGPSEKLRAS